MYFKFRTKEERLGLLLQRCLPSTHKGTCYLSRCYFAIVISLDNDGTDTITFPIDCGMLQYELSPAVK